MVVEEVPTRLARRRRRDVPARLRRARARGHAARPRRLRRPRRGVHRRRAGAARRVRLAQPAGRHGRPDVARRSRSCAPTASTASASPRLHRGVPERRVRGEPGHRGAARAPVRAAVRPARDRDHRGGVDAARRDPARPRRRAVARPGPHPARPPRRGRGDRPHQRLRPDRHHLSFKIASAAVPDMPKPYPLFEIFVYAPEMEGIHLRGGRVARGGIRWSDRLEDYRTEILGPDEGADGQERRHRADRLEGRLRPQAPAGRPRGAEGGGDAPVRRLHARAARPHRQPRRRPGRASAERVAVLDDDDPYLVVAADKGTATFSDTANAVSAEYGFWLGDAFASGGSAGYDHKALGITARGAWESVMRHFRELGIDVMNDPFTVVGIGDMSGDVFGNGMLLLGPDLPGRGVRPSPRVHRPGRPTRPRAFAERKRLFELPGSSLGRLRRVEDLARAAASGRAGQVDPASRPRRALALGIDAEQLSPSELICGDPAGPGRPALERRHRHVRQGVDRVQRGRRRPRERRPPRRRPRPAGRVVGEGGNLGFTQRGRIEYAQAGGRINTDAIDNSAGVDCSDHEVNLKILLGLAVQRGDLTSKSATSCCRRSSDDVVRHVLYDNFLQAQILSQEAVIVRAPHGGVRGPDASGSRPRACSTASSSPCPIDRGDGGAARARAAAWRGPSSPCSSRTPSRASRTRCCVLAAGLGVPRARPRALLPAAGGRAVRLPAERAPAAARADRDDRRQRRRELAGHHVRLAGRDRDRARRPPTSPARTASRATSRAPSTRWDEVEALVGKLEPALLDELMVGVDWLVEVTARWYLQHVPGQLGRAIEAHAERFREFADGDRERRRRTRGAQEREREAWAPDGPGRPRGHRAPRTCSCRSSCTVRTWRRRPRHRPVGPGRRRASSSSSARRATSTGWSRAWPRSRRRRGGSAGRSRPSRTTCG